MFFAYVGFDAVSTAAEETKNPQRNVPIGLIGSLLFCTVFYILVAAGAIGTHRRHSRSWTRWGFRSRPARPNSRASARCPNMPRRWSARRSRWRTCSRCSAFTGFGNAIGLAAFLALPSVILVLIFGQTRIFFVMSRDGLLPEMLSTVHPKFRTPHVVTMITGVAVAIAAAFFPVGQLADISNAGTLYAFLMVAIAVLMLRVKGSGAQALVQGAGGVGDRPADDRRLRVPVPQPADCGDAVPARSGALSAWWFTSSTAAATAISARASSRWSTMSRARRRRSRSIRRRIDPQKWGRLLTGGGPARLRTFVPYRFTARTRFRDVSRGLRRTPRTRAASSHCR